MQKGGFMSMRKEAADFLNGLVIGFLVTCILVLIFLYLDFIPLYSYVISLCAGGFASGIIARGTFRGGISAFFSGSFAIFLLELVKSVLTLEHQFSFYEVIVWLFFAVFGGLAGGFITKPVTVIVPEAEPQKVYICPHCEAEIPMKTKFCPHCGKRLGKAPITEKVKDLTKYGGEES